jgi:adenylate kinase
LVPDELTIKSWLKYIDAQVTLNAYKPESDLLVLDGIPRNVHQAEMMEEIIDVLSVVELYCEDQQKMIERIRRRALKENRFDDAKEDVIRNRWEVYREETKPVVDHYRSDIYHRIDALQSPAGVLHDIIEALQPVQHDHHQATPAAPTW